MKYIAIIIISLGLSSCETMFAHFKIEDSAVYHYGGRNALAEKCVEKDYLKMSEVSKYNHFAGLYLDLAVINEEAFKKGYSATKKKFEIQSDASIKELCNQGKKFYPSMADLLEKNYYKRKESLGQSRKAELSQISNSLSEISQSMNKSAATYNSYKFTPPTSSLPRKKRFSPTPMYNSNQCIGSIINGKCYGSTIGVPKKKCYGTVILGKCHGSLL